MINAFRSFILFSLILLSCSIAFSQDRNGGVFRLGPDDLSADNKDKSGEILSASRTLKDASDVPVTVHIISRKEILENGYITLVDALKSVPGVRVSQPGSAIEGETFLLRGLHGNYYCKILIDGVPVQPSVVSGMPISAQLPIRQAERIEITFGPSSSIYGSDALAGVINIVTHQSDRPVTAQADIAMGNDGQEYLNVGIGGKAGKNKNVVTYSLFGSYFSRRDMKIKSDVSGVYNPAIYDSTYSFLQAPYYKGDSTAPEFGRLPAFAQMIGFSLKWRGLAFQFISMNRKTQSSIGQRTDLYSYANPSNFWGENIRRYTLTYQHSGSRLYSLTTLSWLNYRLDNLSSFGLIYPVGNSPNAYKYAASDDLFLEQQFTFLPVSQLELTAGANLTVSGNLPKTNDLHDPFNTSQYTPFSEDPISDTAFGTFGYNPITFYNASGFLQLYLTLGRFVVIAGDRYDYHSIYEGANSLRLALLFKASKKLSFRASFSQGFRAPSAYYSYASVAYKEGDSIYYSTIPNPGLKPEKVLAAEVGARWEPGDHFSLDASAFYHRLSKQFTRSYVLLDTSAYPLAVNQLFAQSYVNDDTSRAELYGVQLSLAYNDIIESIHLTAELELSFSKGKEILAYPRGSIDSYRQWPGFLGEFNVSLRPARALYLYFRNYFSTSWTKQYFPFGKDLLDELGYETTTKGFYTLDVLARIYINRNFQAYFQLNNVFNANYAGIDAYGSELDLRYNPQYGRNFRLGLTFTLE